MVISGISAFAATGASSILQLVFWGILGVANSLFSWLSSGRMGDFNSQGLISYALWPFIALIVGIFLSQRVNNPRLMLVPALLWLVLDTHIMLFQSLIQYLGIWIIYPIFSTPIFRPYLSCCLSGKVWLWSG